MTKPLYEAPRLVRHQTGLMNKFGHIQAVQPLTHIDGVAVADLVAEYGSPLFVYSQRSLANKYRELRDAMALRYPKVRLAWSYKTNYLGAVCKVFHSEGAWAEVVSDFEYDKAIHNGIPTEQIHFNGPAKHEEILARAFSGGSMVHIEHFDELALAEKVADELGIRPAVAIRVNITTTGTPVWSRFGFGLESGHARDAVRRIQAGNKLDLVGIHCHLGTFIQNPSVYQQAAGKLAGFANALRAELGITLDFIDVGGGIASANALKHQFRSGQETPAFARYAEAVSDGLSALEYPPDQLPTLVLESGRALVDEAGYMITSVLANKQLPEGSRGVVVDAGVNVLFTSFWYNHEVAPGQEVAGPLEPTTIYGPLCMNIDVIRDTMSLPPLKPGNLLVFRNVGAYNVTQWMQFITYRPPVVMISPEGEHGLIREREDLNDVIGPERLPGWM